MKRIILAVVAVASLALQSCDDTDVALGVGFVGGVIVGGAAGHNHGYCRGGYYTQCSTYINYWGERIRECRQVYDSCGRRWSSEVENQNTGFSDLAQNVADFNTPEVSASVPVASVASKYQISFDGAQKVVSALSQGEQGNIEALRTIGFSKSDLVRLYQGKNVSEKTVARLSQSLNLSQEATQGFMTQVKDDVQAARDAQAQ